jgi:hypothetical protein
MTASALTAAPPEQIIPVDAVRRVLEVVAVHFPGTTVHIAAMDPDQPVLVHLPDVDIAMQVADLLGGQDLHVETGVLGDLHMYPVDVDGIAVVVCATEACTPLDVLDRLMSDTVPFFPDPRFPHEA